MSEPVPIGSRVRVRRGCPHTLPHFARVLPGEVVGPPEGGLVQVKFGERFFPVAMEWLELTTEPDPDADD